MTQSIFVNVGQCGNQIGYCFWDLALKEHAKYDALYGGEESFQTFFKNSPFSPGYKARSVMIDMETGVVDEIKKSPLRNIFDYDYLITDVSGSGNNWATGNLFYGEKYRDDISNAVRKAAEPCDFLQCFFLMHSMGGGTGSGIGTRILKMLSDEYPEVHRIVTSVFPSENDDVITSPYNTILAMNELTNFADCVFPVENEALRRIALFLRETSESKTESANNSTVAKLGSKRTRTFDEMNNIVANMLLDLTCSSRFSGSLNVDLNEISMNMVPFPKMQYLLASQSPLNNSGIFTKPRNVDQLFTEAYQSRNQLTTAEPTKHTFLASAALVRGKITISEMRKSIDKLHSKLRFVPWNLDAWKVGHCYAPPLGMETSLVSFSNNTAIATTFNRINKRFQMLYRRKAHLHHYTVVDGFDCELFKQCEESLIELESSYSNMENTTVDETKLSTIPVMQIAD